jgi:transposase InsO family protein
MVASKGVLPNLGGDVTREAILEYARAVSPRYHKAGKREKGLILDEFCKTTGHHRKSVVRLLRNPPEAKRRGLGRPKEYGRDVVSALRRVWEVSDHLCSKRLVPFLAELVKSLEGHGELELIDEVRVQLLGMSASTMDRELKPYRAESLNLRRPYTTRRSPGELKALIPIRTFGEWAEVKPGSVQVDLVAHCGESTEGFYLNTLVSVDVATSWSEFEVIWGKGKERVGSGVHKSRQRMPFPLEEIHTDNGSEFINDLLYPWTKNEGIRFTRGRAYKKNDQAYVEQKNWSVPRRLIGYDRYSSKEAYEQMARLYGYVRLYVNYFQPVSKLIEKERDGAKVKKKYDEAKTPYQRLLASDVFDQLDREEAGQGEVRREVLAKLYASLNPAKLRRQIDDSLEVLWKLTDWKRAERKLAESARGAKQVAKPASEPALEPACG